MAAAINGGKIMIYQPYARAPEPGANDVAQGQLKLPQSGKQDQMRFLNTNKNIVAIESGALDPN